ncbi:hypothetical protein JMJ77_0002147 [Colletotrichum scovillei]|uniref:Uncharacterized protein n=1 Tax=Colletotrichum scovillei TaxID=1209932 RepID=A0A9P7UGB1_9PEZI|nr:hypothetical protein JMJ77_0002147 [Colletotrichum scovillei]KAG7070563.1 hypothetical protein JMJ76_0001812 [Colletotrichum scovillei]KAG7078814.1 hypothetical protein JMJ78_0002479 [Colletotrichum scovillei]
MSFPLRSALILGPWITTLVSLSGRDASHTGVD